MWLEFDALSLPLFRNDENVNTKTVGKFFHKRKFNFNEKWKNFLRNWFRVVLGRKFNEFLFSTRHTQYTWVHTPWKSSFLSSHSHSILPSHSFWIIPFFFIFKKFSCLFKILSRGERKLERERNSISIRGVVVRKWKRGREEMKRLHWNSHNYTLTSSTSLWVLSFGPTSSTSSSSSSNSSFSLFLTKQKIKNPKKKQIFYILFSSRERGEERRESWQLISSIVIKKTRPCVLKNFSPLLCFFVLM